VKGFSTNEIAGGLLVVSGAAALFLVDSQGYGWMSEAIAAMALALMLFESRSWSTLRSDA